MRYFPTMITIYISDYSIFEEKDVTKRKVKATAKKSQSHKTENSWIKDDEEGNVSVLGSLERRILLLDPPVLLFRF